MKTFVLGLLLSISFTHAAPSTLVKCWADNDVKDTGVFKIGSNGLIEVFKRGVSDNLGQYAIIAKTVKQHSLFSGFTMVLEEDGQANMFLTRNGYTVAEFYTTAETETVGINLSKGDGFYRYKDNGSGNGNSTVKLTCQKAN